MMSTGQVFTRVVVIALILGAIDAVAGRLLQAQPDPSVVLSLGATAWVAYRLAEGGQPRLGLVAAVATWVVYMAGFALWAQLLVGWNGSVPWRPRSTTWLIALAMSAPVVAVIAQRAGTRAASRAAARAAGTTATSA